MDGDLVMADSAVELQQGRCLTLIMENHGPEPVCLKQGTILGGVTPVTKVTSIGCEGAQGTSEQDLEDGFIQSLSPNENTSGDRGDQLLAQLDLKANPFLTPKQQQQLRQFIVSYADVFALDSSELGTTNIVTHTIDR